MNDHQELVLEQLKSIREELKVSSRKQAEDSERLVRIETLIKPLFDNGQPGLLSQIKDELDEKADVSELDEIAAKVDEVVTLKNKALGVIAVLGTTCLALIGKLIYLTFGIQLSK